MEEKGEREKMRANRERERGGEEKDTWEKQMYLNGEKNLMSLSLVLVRKGKRKDR